MSTLRLETAQRQREGMLAQQAIQRIVTATSGHLVEPLPYRPNVYAWANVAAAPVVVLPVADQLDGRFKELAERWKRETQMKSRTTDVVLNDAYQRILAMGRAVVPLIFRELRAEGDNPSFWFWALERLTDANPVPAEERGSARKSRAHWLTWADNNGYGGT